MSIAMGATKVRIQNRIQSSRFIGLILVGIVLTSTGCRCVERKLVYHPERFPKNWSEPSACELNGIQFESVFFSSGDGTKLHGWFLQPNPVPDSPRRVDPLPILFAHGRSGNVASFQSDLFQFVKRHQASVFVFDYRGYGKSHGCPTERGLYDDALAARDWLAHRMEATPEQIVLMGRSLGAAVAIDLANRGGAKALVLESGFTSMPDMVKRLSCGILEGRNLEGRYESINKIGSFSGPVFISHAKNDKLIPFEHGIQLANRATGASSVQFVATDGGHRTKGSEEYRLMLGQFLKRL